MNSEQDTIQTIVMHPNGKQPLSAFKSWKPSDGYIDCKRALTFQRVLLIAALIALGFGLTAWSTV